MNSINFTGGLGRDCETRFTAKGDAITSFSVALSSGYGESKLTTWLNCSIFGKRGEALSPYLLKGSQVAISGEFSARPYTNKAGEEKLSLEVRVNDLTLIGGKQDGAKANDKPATNVKQDKPDSLDDFIDDPLPF
jgi:single-strand DNA-binding protein